MFVYPGYSIKPPVALMSVERRPVEVDPLQLETFLAWNLHRTMAFGLDYDMNAFYSGHYWNATCLDVTKIDLYAQDSRSGERLLLFL